MTPRVRQKHARNLVVMLTSGGVLGRLLVQAQQLGIVSEHIEALDVFPEEEAAKAILVKELSI